jgi:uncharacterized repeat protein (TIGR03806 family)
VRYFAEGRPAKLSDWHVVYADGGKLSLNVGVVPYDLNTPLFSDYAHKLRTVWMPRGTSAKYAANDSFDFPVETRILVRRVAGWEALPYVWNANQTDAELARTGDAKPLELISDDGVKEPFTYVVPNENQCAGCHVVDLKTKQIAPIGPKSRHLNRDFTYADQRENQLLHWSKLGYLSGAPDAAQAPRNANWRDSKAPLDARARAYLDVNCGHCHNPKGPANTTALDLTIFAAADRFLGVCKPPVAAGRGTGDHFFDVVPGRPDDSILPFRMQSSEPGVMMPEQGRTTTHQEGVALIKQWIAAMGGLCTPETQAGL